MRIGIVTWRYRSLVSGSEKGVQHLAKSVAKRGVEVHIITTNNEPRSNNSNIRIHSIIGKITTNRIFEFIEIIPTVYKIIKISKKYQFDILNVHGHRSEALSTVIAGKILNIPTILTWIHADVGFDTFKPETLFGALLLRSVKLMAKLSVKLADQIMLKGILPEIFIEKYNINKEKIFHTSNPIKVPKDASIYQNEEIGRKYKLEDKFVVTIVSTRLEKERGIENVLKAAKIIKEKNLQDIKFLIVGGVFSHILDYWKKKAKEYDIEDYVIFAGYQKNVYPFLYYSDLYIVGLKSEVGWGRAQLEAMAMELPVISRKTKTFAYWFKHLHNVYFVEEDTPEEFAKAIIYLKKNDTLRENIGKNARETVLKEWDMEKFVEKFIKTCKNLVNEKTKTRKFGGA